MLFLASVLALLMAPRSFAQRSRPNISVPMAGPVWTARANVAVLLGFGIVAVIDGVMRVMRVESDAQ